MNAALDRRIAANKDLPARGKATRARDRREARKAAQPAFRAPIVAQPVVNETPKTADEWYRFAKRNGLVKLGQGASRKTYALDDKRVIKVDYNGWKQCNSEAARWNASSEEQRKLLAAVLDSGDGWVIMERAKTTLGNFTHDENARRTISRDLSIATNVGDLHAANIGYFGNGIFKIIDYAL